MKKINMRLTSFFAILIITCFCFATNVYADPTENTETGGTATATPTEAPPATEVPTAPPATETPTAPPATETPTAPPATATPTDPPQATDTPTAPPATDTPTETPQQTVAPTVKPSTPTPTEVPKRTQAPATNNDDDDSQQTAAGTTNNSSSSSQQEQNKTTVERPKATINPNSSNEVQTNATPKPSNYVTFARLNIQKNSLAQNLFLAGAVCIAIGLIGVGTIIVFAILRKRRRNASPENGEIFAAIEEAEERQKTLDNPENFEDYQSQNEEEYEEYDSEDYENDDEYEGHYYNQDEYSEQESDEQYYEEYDDYQDNSDDFEEYDSGAQQEQSQQESYSDNKSYDIEDILRDALNYSQDDADN